MIRLVTNQDDSIKISGQSESGYINYSVSGEGFNSDYARFRQTYKSSSMQVDSMTQKLEVLYKQPQSAETQSMIAKLKTQRTENRKFQNEMKMNFITSNFDADLSAYLLISMGTGILESFYPQLSINVKNGVFSTYMNKILDELRMTTDNKSKVQVGKLAPDFTLKNQTGEDVTLSSFKGKYIVLDFWATWCKPCIEAMPKMNEYYDKYKDSVEFVGIACAHKKSTWITAIDKYNLEWTQLFNDLKAIDKDVTLLYGIHGFPTKIILDRNLNIILIAHGATDEFYNKLDQLLL